MICQSFGHQRCSLFPFPYPIVNPYPKGLMWFDEVVPRLEEIDRMSMHLHLFTEVHGSPYESCKRVPEGEIQPFDIRSVDRTTIVCTKKMHHRLRIAKHYSLYHLHYSAFLSFLTHLRIPQITGGDQPGKWFSSPPLVRWLFYHPVYPE